MWIPIESDPDILTEYLQSLSLSGYYLIDVPVIEEAASMGLFDEHNVRSYIFLFESNDKAKSDLVGRLEENDNNLAGVFYMKQTISNACGTMALYHAFLNSCPSSELSKYSLIGNFYYKAMTLKTPEERATLFEKNEEAEQLHQSMALQGQTECPNEEQMRNIKPHYVALVWANKQIFELDGCKPGPVNHGCCAEEVHFRIQALDVIKKLMARDPDNYNYGVIALCAPKAST